MSDASDKNRESQAAEAAEPKSIWDNSLPPGDSPPLPRWPLTAAIAAYSCWMAFLAAMMIVRLATT